MKLNDLLHHSDKELQTLLADQRQLLHNLKYNNRISPVENPARIRHIRRDIARILTVMNQRRLQQPSPVQDVPAEAESNA